MPYSAFLKTFRLQISGPYADTKQPCRDYTNKNCILLLLQANLQMQTTALRKTQSLVF